MDAIAISDVQTFKTKINMIIKCDQMEHPRPSIWLVVMEFGEIKRKV